MNITSKQIINYAALPGFRTRLHALFMTGFAYIPFFIALVYQAVRLLPSNHPYVNPVNIGQYGLRHVIAEAANNLVWTRKNIDQILLFSLILFGLIIALVQILLVGFSVFAQPVMAQMPTNFSGFFITQNPQQDLAFIFLDLVFGIPDFFGSCVDPSLPICEDIRGEQIKYVLPGQLPDAPGQWILAGLDWPHPIHVGLHQMFQVYSIGLLVVAVMIAFYFIVTIVAETAQTGTAFGKRFNKVWAPIRIVVAFGLLIPTGYGLNTSQYIVLYAAKFGSSFASNGWQLFNETLNSQSQEQYINATTLVSSPNPPEVGGLLQFMYIAQTCREAYALVPDAKTIEFYLVKDPLASPNHLLVDSNTTYQQMIDFVEGDSQANIAFGYRDPDNTDYLLYRGQVGPLCGEISLTLTDPRNPQSTDNPPEAGTRTMQGYYWFVLKEMWFSDLAFFGYPKDTAEYYTSGANNNPDPPNPPLIFKSDTQNFYSSDLRAVMAGDTSTGLPYGGGSGMEPGGAVQAMAGSNRWDMDPSMAAKGWAAGAVWYNRIAEMNGAMTSAVLNIPVPSAYPMVMEHVKEIKRQRDKDVSIARRFEPILSDGKDVPFNRREDAKLAEAFYSAFKYWQDGGHTTTSFTSNSQNAFIEAIHALFGTEGLYSMRQNNNVHPLAQLVGVGRSLVESAVRNIGYATLGGVGGGIGSFLEPLVGEIGKTAVGFFMSIAMVSLTAGFVLYYIVPFLPFIYFFFAVGGWVKGIFEAMVGAPLWALAHIRIDGNGLPGSAAVNGYFLIFEIFLRPILIIFGLLASISIFSALISVMNEIWTLVTSNISGFDVKTEVEIAEGGAGLPSIDYFRGPLDQFFFTVVYALVAYLMGMSSFKLIDLIPNNILRWMGQSVATFNDSREDPAQGLVGTATIGSQQVISNVGQGYKGALEGVAGMGKK